MPQTLPTSPNHCESGCIRLTAGWLNRLALTVIVSLTLSCSRTPAVGVTTEVPWSVAGQWIVADTHTHTRFSDGNLSISDLVARAQANGCDALAITDHSDVSEKAATPEYFAAIREARTLHPNLLIVAGMEWNIPPYAGREHMSVLIAPALEAKILPQFKQQFENNKAKADEALRWLRQRLDSEQEAVLIYNHPSRNHTNVHQSESELLSWRAVNHLVIGFEGAPGHQKNDPIGAYKHKLKTVDRWDPVAANMGGVWDHLLDQGHDVWAALATSDYHNDKMDYSPCAFARTHILVPQRTVLGVLRALRAGSFWADEGHLLSKLHVTVSAPGLLVPLVPGETARIDPKQPVELTIALQRDAGAEGSALNVELIGNGALGKPSLLQQAQLKPDQQTIKWTFRNLVSGGDKLSAYFRVRVRKAIANGPDLIAYSNPIRLILR